MGHEWWPIQKKAILQNIAVVLCQIRLEKQPILGKWEHFENWQKWPPSKGYSLGKMVTLGQKLKMQKNMLKTFLQDIAVVLCKKRLEKTANIRKMRAFWKLPQVATKQRPLQNRHFGSKIKNAKKHPKNVSTTYCSCSMKKKARKKLIFEKWEHFENGQKWPSTIGYTIAFAKSSLLVKN